jgi:hypothetical protein
MLMKRLVTPAQHVGGVQQQLTSMRNHVLLKTNLTLSPHLGSLCLVCTCLVTAVLCTACFGPFNPQGSAVLAGTARLSDGKRLLPGWVSAACCQPSHTSGDIRYALVTMCSRASVCITYTNFVAWHS